MQPSMFDDQRGRLRVMFDQNTDLFPIKCANASCKHEFFQQIGSIKAGDEVRCPACKTVQLYSADEFVRKLEQVKETGQDVFRDFIDLKPKP